METPKKNVTKGPALKKKPHGVSDFCRLCKCNFLVTGVAKCSTENLFKPSERKESKGFVLADGCVLLGLSVVKTPALSDRVCRSCGRKIRNAIENFTFIKQNLEAQPSVPEPADPATASPIRTKRLLPTTITPDRRDVSCKQARKESEPSSKKQLFANDDQVNNDNQRDLECSKSDETCSESQVRVVVTYPNGDVVVRTNFDKRTLSLIRSIALKQWKTAANVAFSHAELMVHIPDALRRQVSCEFTAVSSDSILKGTSPEEIAAFSNKIFLHEISVQCPLWYSCIHGACGITQRQSTERQNRAINVMALSTSVLARHRNPTLSALAYRISMLLFHSGVSYCDTIRLNHLGICMSPDSTVELQKKMGIASDSKVLIWKKDMEDILSAVLLLQEVKQDQVPELKEDDMAIDVDIDFTEEKAKTYSSYGDQSNFKFCTKVLDDVKSKNGDDNISDTTLCDAIHLLQHKQLPRFRIVGDNIDYLIQARIQSSDNTNQSIHWTQQYGVLDRVNDPSLDNTKPQKLLKDLELNSLLPVKEVQECFKRNCAVLVSRVISKYLRVFKHMQDVVIRHIPHTHTEEMSSKSEICCLGLQFKNPNVAGEMAELIKTDQDKYVPCIERNGKSEVLSQIPLHGDQLFEERARNVKWTFQDGTTTFERLEGITTEAADWHAKLNLYSIEFDTFVSDSSAREIGTSRASMNRTGKTRAAQGVKKCYNEYKDFHQREIEAHICASFMEMLNMETMDGEADLAIPGPEVEKETRRRWFLNLSQEYVNKYFGCSEILALVDQVHELQANKDRHFPCRAEGCQCTYAFHSRRVRHEIEVHDLKMDTGSGDRDPHGYYYCRARCGLVFSTRATRNRHERTQHADFNGSDDQSDESKSSEDHEDYLYNYHLGKLVLGLLLLEFEDSIKEGDGDRLLDVYKLALLFYKCYGHHKYAYIVLLLLVLTEGALSEFQAQSMKCNRFYNKYGGKGRNIPLDLRMEQLNKILKAMWRALGANLNEKNASRVANSIEGLELILDSIDSDCALSNRKGYRSKGNADKAVKQIVTDLIDKSVFIHTAKRAGYPSFPKAPSNLLQDLDYRDLHSWITARLKEWAPIIESQTK